MTDNSCEQINRKFSKAIAKAWLADDSEGKKIHQTLLEGSSEKLKELLRKYQIPVRDDCEYVVDRGSFEVSIFIDEKAQISYVRLPYPPRPTEVEDLQLNEWVDDDDPKTVAPSELFLPRACACSFCC